MRVCELAGECVRERMTGNRRGLTLFNVSSCLVILVTILLFLVVYALIFFWLITH